MTRRGRGNDRRERGNDRRERGNDRRERGNDRRGRGNDRRERWNDEEGALGMTRGREKDGEEGAERTIWTRQTLSQGLWIPAYAGMTGRGALALPHRSVQVNMGALF